LAECHSGKGSNSEGSPFGHMPLLRRIIFILKIKIKKKETGSCFSLFFNQIKIKKAGG
jgi:hypothetical protein